MMSRRGPSRRWKMLQENLRYCLVFAVFLLLAVAVMRPGFTMSDFSRPVILTYIDATFVNNITEMLDEDHSLRCLDLSRKFPEPYTDEYQNQKIDLDGPMYSFYRTNNSIVKSQIVEQRNSKASDCRLAIKVKDRALYVHHENECFPKVSGENATTLKNRYDRQMELILLALEIYDVPDADFILELSDGPIPAGPKGSSPPGLSYCISTDESARDGFTYPSYGAYSSALGKQQLRLFHACQRIKYPLSDRIPKAVWRGSTTGKGPLRKASDVYRNRRASLARLGYYTNDTMDVGLYAYVQLNKSSTEVMEALESLSPIKARVDIDDFSNYAAVIDLDGNAWSDRLPHLLMSDTPVLKQEYSGWFEYFGHLLTEKEVTFFKDDLTDIVQKTNELVTLYKTDRNLWESKISAASHFAMEHLSHHGVIRAMAYAITKQASLQNWAVSIESGYVQIPRSLCCHLNPSLPKELLDKMQSS